MKIENADGWFEIDSYPRGILVVTDLAGNMITAIAGITDTVDIPIATTQPQNDVLTGIMGIAGNVSLFLLPLLLFGLLYGLLRDREIAREIRLFRQMWRASDEIVRLHSNIEMLDRIRANVRARRPEEVVAQVVADALNQTFTGDVPLPILTYVAPLPVPHFIFSDSNGCKYIFTIDPHRMKGVKFKNAVDLYSINPLLNIEIDELWENMQSSSVSEHFGDKYILPRLTRWWLCVQVGKK